jgi:hypothetical protein
MKIVKVTYTTQPDFAAQNAANIKIVMDDLQKLNHPGINYSALLGADEKTFTHIAYFTADEDQKTLGELPSFRQFQEQLKASQPETPPKQEILSLVGTSKH